MALSADSIRQSQPNRTRAFKVANAEVTLAGSFAAIKLEEFATSASRGYLDVYSNAEGILPLGGFCKKGVTGDTSATPVVKEIADLDGMILEEIAVTGVSAQADVGKHIYASDDDTLTLTRPTYGLPIGVITRWYSSTTCDVLLFSFETICAIALSGAGKQLWNLGLHNLTQIASGASGDLATSIVAPFFGRIVDFYGTMAVAATASADVDINLEIGAVNLTGGTLNVASTNALGAKIVAASAITATNIFHEGDLISIEQVSTTLDATAQIQLWAEVEPLLGI